MSERYVQHDNPAFEAWIAGRTATREAAFLLPLLKPGIRVLDVGCGPGMITVGLAEVVSPGEVVGVDLQAVQVEQARSLAVQRNLPNLRFQVADVYRLPFPDGSFDAVLAHAVVMHLRDPVGGLREIRRVLRPGGVAGARDWDLAASILSPMTPLLEEWLVLASRVREHHQMDSFTGRHHRALFLDAGFARAECKASADVLGTGGSLEETRRNAGWYKSRLLGVGRTALAEGWVTQAKIDAMMAEIDAWAERPDAFAVEIVCETLGWAPE